MSSTIEIKKNQIFDNTTKHYPLFGYIGTTADHAQRIDKKSFNRKNLSNLIPTIGGILVTDLYIV